MGEFLGSHGEAAPRREGLRERILGRDVLAAVAAQRLLLLGAGGQRRGPLLRQVLLVGDAVADPQVDRWDMKP